MILDERGFTTFTDWADRAKDLLTSFGNPGSPGDDWRQWGSNLGLLPGMPVFPSPRIYNDWRAWVRDLNRTVNVT